MSNPIRNALELWFTSVWRPRIELRYLQPLWFVLWLAVVGALVYNLVNFGPESVDATFIGIVAMSGVLINGFCVAVELFARWRGIDYDHNLGS